MGPLIACIALLVLCRLWHRERCRQCRKQMERDINAETAVLEHAIRTIEQRRAMRRARGVKR